MKDLAKLNGVGSRKLRVATVNRETARREWFYMTVAAVHFHVHNQIEFVEVIIVRESYQVQLRAASSKPHDYPQAFPPVPQPLISSCFHHDVRTTCTSRLPKRNKSPISYVPRGRALGGLVESHFERHARLGVTADGRVAHPREIPEGGLGGGGEGELAQEEAENDL